MTEALFTLEQVKQSAAEDEEGVLEYRQLTTTAKQQKYDAKMAGDKRSMYCCLRMRAHFT